MKKFKKFIFLKKTYNGYYIYIETTLVFNYNINVRKQLTSCFPKVIITIEEQS